MGVVKKIIENFKRYQELKEKLNPNNDMFIEMTNTPDWKEFNELTIKLAPIFKKMGLRNIKVLGDSIEVLEEIKRLNLN